jgi:citronellol/citronellal dehydrogenase
MPVAVITGGGGGIGGACARSFSREGYAVVLMGRTEESLRSVAEQIRDSSGEASTFVADVRNWDRIQELADQLKEQFGSVDILVNSAGGQFHAAATKISPNGWSAVIDTNLTGTFYMCRALHDLLADGTGSVVNVVANVWQRGAPEMAHSGAARAGVVSLTRSLALEWATDGIRVNALSPGLTDTAGLRNEGADMEAKAERVPLKRCATAEEVAEAAWFLAGPTGSYITGTVLVVDGGLQLA